MSWRGVVYIFAGMFGVFYVLPKMVWLIADFMHRYIHSGSADATPPERGPLDAVPKAVGASRAAPLFKADAKQRQREHGRTAPEREGNTSPSLYGRESREQAGRPPSADRQHASELKPIVEKKPELIPKMLSGEVNMLEALKKARFKQAGQR